MIERVLLSFIITVLLEKNYLYKISFILVRGLICIIYFHLICFYIVKEKYHPLSLTNTLSN